MGQKDIISIRKEQQERKKQSRYHIHTFLFMMIIILSLFLAFIYGNSLLLWCIKSLPIKQPPIVLIDPLAQSIKNIEFSYTWNIVSMPKQDNLYLNLDINNHNQQDISSLEILCTPEDTLINVLPLKVTIFENMRKNTKTTIEQYNFGQLPNKVNIPNMNSITCIIHDVSFVH